MKPSDVETSNPFYLLIVTILYLFCTIVSNKKLKTIILWNIN
nr:MAG TPA: hypothetical protein [Caudoviricetes sp.]DAP57553.1 MAG TPA: hypothetical protein [Caudoviricetes sp.]